METVVLISGSRDIDDYKLISDSLKIWLQPITNPSFVLGGARGVDSLALKYAEENKIPYKIFKANWNLYGKRAGMVRNGEMFRYAPNKRHILIAFSKNKSAGTQNMINRAEEKGWRKAFEKQLTDEIVGIVYEE